MKKLFLILFVLLLGCTRSGAESFTEGKHYRTLDLPEIEGAVWEVYSVFCPFCERFDASINPAVQKALPAGARLDSVYLAPYGVFGRESAAVLAVMKVLGDGRYEKVKSFYFDEIIRNKGALFVGKDRDFFIDKGLEAGGVSREEYEKTLASAEAQAVLSGWGELAVAIVAESRGIPALVVKGRYLVNLEQVSSEEMLIDEVLYLLKK